MRNINFVTLITGFSIFTLLSCSKTKEDSEVMLTVLTSMERIQHHQKPFGESKAVIKAAKNEVESFQVVVSALHKNIRVVAAEISDLRGEAGTIGKENIALFREAYAPLVRLAATDLAGNRLMTRKRVTWGLTPTITSDPPASDITLFTILGFGGIGKAADPFRRSRFRPSRRHGRGGGKGRYRRGRSRRAPRYAPGARPRSRRAPWRSADSRSPRRPASSAAS